MNKKHIYLAGSLFSEAEIAQRLKEGALIKEILGDDYTLYNPIEAPCNDKSKLPTADDIFVGDTRELLASDYVIADLSNNDPGVMMELGIAWGVDYCAEVISNALEEAGVEIPVEVKAVLHASGIKPKGVQAVLSDIRLGSAHNYNGRYIPMSYNQYVIGGIEHMEGTICSSFEEAANKLKR